MPIKVIIADDHTMFLNGLALLLNKEEDIELVGSATSGLGVIELLQEHSADVVVSDLTMPGMSGHDLLDELRRNYSNVKMIALTMHSDGKTISQIIKNGVDGYLPKDADKGELLEAIRAVAAGNKHFGERAKQALVDNLIPEKKEMEAHELAAGLTDREKEILVLIAAEHTQEEIAEKLFISPNTVVYHKRKLMVVLEVKSAAGLVRKAAEMGLLTK